MCYKAHVIEHSGRAWRLTEENQQIFSVTEYDCKQKWPNLNEKSQLVDNAIYRANEFKAYLKTILNKEVNIMRVFRHKKLCIPILVRFSQKVSTSNVVRTEFEIKK